MIHYNYDCDFKIAEPLYADAPFRYTYYAKNEKTVVAEYDGTDYHRCYPMGDTLIVPINAGSLGLGEVKVRREYYLTDKDFTDGICNRVTGNVPLGIEIWRGETDGMETHEVKVVPAYQKGDPFTFDDMTDAQKQDIANRVPTKEAEREQAEVTRERNEELRQSNEAIREANETSRKDAEVIREENEKRREETYQQKADKATVEAIQKKELKLSVKDNGNIILSNADGESKEFMPATPSGDPMHWNLVDVGFEWNGTGADITKKGEYGDTIIHKAGYWYLNEVGDLTTAEARSIYRNASFVKSSDIVPLWFVNNTDRSILSFCNGTYSVKSYNYAFYGIKNAERIRLSNHTKSLFVANANGMFQYSNYKYILGEIQFRNVSAAVGMFSLSRELIEFRLAKLNISLSISDSPNISKNTILYIINKIDNSGTYAPKKPITVTLHADAYARLADDADIIAALENKNAALEGTGGSISLVSA